MANSDRESRCEKQPGCLYKHRHESIVCAVMFAIVTSILGSAMFSLSQQGTDKNVAKQEVCEISVNCNCLEQMQSHFAQTTVRYGKKESHYPALLRALALFLFCAGYFGDEWRQSIIEDRVNRGGETDDKRELQDFPLEFIGWLFFALQACLVNELVLYASLGAVAICCVSLDLGNKKLRNIDAYGTQGIDDWLCENAIWMTWLLLAMILPLNAVILSGMLFLVALLICITKMIEWTEGRHHTRRTLVFMSIFFPLPLMTIGFFFN